MNRLSERVSGSSFVSQRTARAPICDAEHSETVAMPSMEPQAKDNDSCEHKSPMVGSFGKNPNLFI